VVGAGLLYLALPRTIAAVLKLPGNPVLTRIQERKPVDAEGLATLIASRKRAVFWADSGRDRAVLGLAQLLLARRSQGAGGYERGLAVDAIDSLRDGLALAPASPHAWTRLAYAELVANGPSAPVASALEMSLRTAPFDPRLLRVRIELCLRAWPYLTAAARRLVHEQVRLAWRQSGSELIAIARHAGREDVVRGALSQRPADRAEFDRAVGSRRD
jgi:hypothetical protein